MDEIRHPLNEFEWTPDSWKPAQAKAAWKSKTTLDIYRTDALVVRSYVPTAAIEAEKSRGLIGKEPSRASLNRLIFVLNNSDIPFRSMLTLTMTPEVHRGHSVNEHKAALKACLERLRREADGQYLWVREFQENGSVHWHIFLTDTVGESGEVNEPLSADWSQWFANYYRKKNGSASCYRKMKLGNQRDFKGCTRWEQLKSDAAGLYASKEGAKRYQKKPPKKWCRGGAWWRGSRGITCTPIKTIDVDAKTLQSTSVDLGGESIEVAFKIQFSRGLKEQ